MRHPVVRIVSYNVLSSHLADAAHFATVDPHHLEASTRFQKVCQTLDQEIQQQQQQQEEMDSSTTTTTSTTTPVIFCLQEVSYDWAGKFHVFFSQRGYHIITGLYGKPYSGYMGILTAVPTSTLKIHNVDIVRLSDTYPWPDEQQVPELYPPPQQPSSLSSLWETWITKPLTSWLGGWISNQPQEEEENPWNLAKRRFNVCITTTLQFRDSTTNTDDNPAHSLFCVANYHMPCCFYAPIVMTLHADAYLAHVQRIATSAANTANNGGTSSTIPYIVTGDFNIVPSEIVYRFLTQTKTIPTDSVAYPKSSSSNSTYTWTPTIQATVRSAYAVATGTEPDFTNYAQTKPDEAPFIDTLDYIFISEHVRVRNVLALPHRDKVQDGPFPNAEQPSDHMLIAADLELPF